MASAGDERPIILDGPAIAHDLEVKASTIRRWGAAGLLTRYGTDGRGRALYDLVEVEQLAATTRRGRPVTRTADRA